MNKKKLIDAAVELCERDLNKADMTEALECVINVITHELQTGGYVDIKSFANFGVKDRAARMGRNPQTGATMEIPAKKLTFCKISKTILVKS